MYREVTGLTYVMIMENIMKILKINYFLQLSLAFVLCATLVGQTRAEPTADIVGGVTTVTLSDDFITLLGTANITPAALEPGTLDDTSVATFPIIAGALDLGTFVGEIAHTGGLSLSSAGETTDLGNVLAKTVDLFNFTIDNAQTRLAMTGLAAVNDDLGGRSPLFNLDFTTALLDTTSVTDTVSITGVVLGLTDIGAAALSEALGVPFTEGFIVGTADVEAITQADDTDGGDDGDGGDGLVDPADAPDTAI